MRLVIFDFCDTITNFQTANEFCKYVLNKESRFGIILLNKIFKSFFIYRIFAKIGLRSWLTEKSLLLSGLRGMSSAKMDEYALRYIDDVVEKNLNKEVYNRFLNHIKIGDIVAINSGGYEPYLKQFAKRHRVVHCYSTQFEFTNEIFNGKILGKDCLGEEKVLRMKSADLLNSSYNEIFVYSDSITDMPIFNLATQKIAVIKGENLPRWCDTSFEIIRVK